MIIGMNVQDKPMQQFEAAAAFTRYQMALWAEG
jgi:hypothetical protein